jgi:hypothetical protein
MKPFKMLKIILTTKFKIPNYNIHTQHLKTVATKKN